MSSALAIASVTAVLKNLLGNALIRQSTDTGMGDVTITALPPDRISTGAEERTQLNLHLYRLTPNTGWRHAGAMPKAQPDKLPLALDLHYLITAYGERDFQAEVILGYAVQCLYEIPVMTHEIIRSALRLTSSRNGDSAEMRVLSFSTLPDQLEQIIIRLEFLNMEEMTKLWSSLQTRARISVTYQVSAVLIENRAASAVVLADVS